MAEAPDIGDMQLVEFEIRQILISQHQAEHPIVLREKGGMRSLTISVGTFEALSINSYVVGEVTLRPRTHELLAEVVTGLGSSIQALAITDVRDDTFYGLLLLENAQGEMVHVDCRPSDGLALVSLLTRPIFVSEQVLADVGS